MRNYIPLKTNVELAELLLLDKTFKFPEFSWGLLKRKLKDRSRRPEGGEWEPIKISFKFESSAYIPKPPQTLEPRSARIAMNKLSRSRRPRSQRGSKGERNFSNRSAAHTDRSDRCTGPVWPVGQFKPRLTGLTGLAHRSDRCRPENPQTNLQTMNLEQTKSKSNQTWRKAS